MSNHCLTLGQLNYCILLVLFFIHCGIVYTERERLGLHVCLVFYFWGWWWWKRLCCMHLVIRFSLCQIFLGRLDFVYVFTLHNYNDQLNILKGQMTFFNTIHGNYFLHGVWFTVSWVRLSGSTSSRFWTLKIQLVLIHGFTIQYMLFSSSCSTYLTL